MSVSGKYTYEFVNATHCVFDGNLDDPSFRMVAIQRIVERTNKEVTLDASGVLPVRRKGRKEYVVLTYQGFFSKGRTTGHPFKDNDTELPNAIHTSEPEPDTDK